MTCKKLRTKALWEQDRWLSYLPAKGDPNIYENTVMRRLPTEQERMDFLCFDSHGPLVAPIPADNIILAGKHAAAVADTEKGADNPKVGGGGWLPYADELYDIMMDTNAPKWAWPGGLEIMEDYLRRVCGLGPLRKQFGDENVQRWLAGFLFYAFGWPDLIMERKYARLYRR